MEFEDLEPKNKIVKPKDLSGWGIGELQAYIERLEGEIARAKAAIAAKDKHRAAAASFFKS
ncbi:MAG: DUF1192 domain-containing protein [Rhodospirillales bacterium]|nr:DUF1192 domain-containing protein [Rhodospirillales bacterium]